MIKDYFKFSLNTLKHRKLRSLLTVIGIVIGIAAVVSLITISSGLDNAIKAQFEMMGSDRIYIIPGALTSSGSFEGLTTDDQQILENIPELESVIPLFVKTTKVEYKRDSKNLVIIGWPEEFIDNLEEDYDLKLKEGNYFSPGQVYSVLIGYLVQEDVFEDNVRVKNKIIINNQEFRVSGVFEEIGNPQDDKQIYIPLSTAREIFDDEESVSTFDLKVKPGVDIDKLVDKIKKKLENNRGNDNFDVYTAEQLQEQVGVILGILQIVIGGIAAISLVVGGIGIMNSMFTSVLERTRDIGIMKSIGASKKDILLIFLIESGFIGFIGGFIGGAIGILISLLVGFVAEMANFQLLKIIIDFKVVLFGILFATLVGAISGIIPAYNASKMRPVEALR